MRSGAISTRNGEVGSDRGLTKLTLPIPVGASNDDPGAQPDRSAEPDPQQEGPSSPHRPCDRGTAAEQACFDHARADDDCVYHFALDELMKAVEESEAEDAQDLLKIMGDKQTVEGYFGPDARSRGLKAFAWA